ncbi:hypothetical protein OROGR_017921 [Orobanche gracilis]
MPQPGNNLKNGAQATPWSGDEFERVPLKQRLKLLLANYRISDLDLTLKSHITSVPPCATDLQLGCSAEGHMTETVGKEERHAGEPQMSVESVDDLEHVVLKERLRRLLASKCLELTPTTLTENSVGAVRGEKQFGNQRHVVSRNQICEIDRILTSGTSRAVGDDLTEGEARVLMEYGWIPNTGLGTMLNYYDRVVHDKWNEKDRSDWRLKIAKLLTDGYNGGTVISAGIPTKVMELDVAHPVDIKLELN